MSSNRTLREKEAYDSGSVFEESIRLYKLFHHLANCPNTLRAEAFFEQKLSQFCKNANVLDYGCLDGKLTPKYQALGARAIVGIDISSKWIATARKYYGEMATFHECDAHDMRIIPDNSLDLIVGRAILHHLEFNEALREIYRVLRPDGAALFVEPLHDNPLSKLFRQLTPRARTKDERPLSRRQIEVADAIFSQHEHYFANFFTTPIAMLTSIVRAPLLHVTASNLPLRIADRVDHKLQGSWFRYWMRVGYFCWIK